MEHNEFKTSDNNLVDAGYELLKYVLNAFTEVHKKVLQNDERVDIYRKIEKEFVIANFYYLYTYYNREKLYEKVNKTESETYLEQYIRETSLFHYTTFNALENILTAKRFKMSCISRMNDPSEGSILLEYLRNVENNSDIIDKFIDIEKKEFSNIYTMSFSLSKEDVAQWERYSQKNGSGNGVCIEIKLFELFKFLHSYYDMFNIYPVYYYSQEEIKKENKDLNLMIFNAYANRSGMNGIKELAVASAFFKDYSFRYEHEIRFTIKYDSNNELCKRSVLMDSNKAIYFNLNDFFETQADSDNKDFNISNLISAIYLESKNFDEHFSKIRKILKADEDKNQMLNIIKSSCPLAT